MSYAAHQAIKTAKASPPQIRGVWLSAFEIQKETAGINKQRDWLIGSATIQEVIAVHAKSRSQAKKSKLRWRVSREARRNVGWIPFKPRAAKFSGGKVRFAGHRFGICSKKNGLSA